MEEEKTTKEKLKEVEDAISAVLVAGQSYKIGSRSVTKAELNTLLGMQKDLQMQQANPEGGLMDNTYVGVFDGR